MKTFFVNVHRRWRNILNALRGVDLYEADDGHRYVGAEVDAYLDREDDE